MVDVLLKNGTVVDGTGCPGYIADVAIKDGCIATIGKIDAANATEVFDCTGKIVTPGFIDAHSHTDCWLLSGRTGYNKLEQGITTDVNGHCGEGSAPSYNGLQEMEDYRSRTTSERFKEIEKACDSFGAFLNEVERMEISHNMAFFGGHGNVRGRVMGFDPAAPKKEQLEMMCRLMEEAMQTGYLGFSTGLVYPPSVYAQSDELAELAKVVHRYGGIYTSHIRNEGSRLIESMKEAIDVGRRSGIPVTISHLKVYNQNSKGLSTKALELLDESNRQGLKVRADQYPYLGGSAPLISQIPPRFMVNGPVKLVESLASKAFREEVEHAIFHETEVFEGGIYAAGWDGCMIAEAEATPDAIGKNLLELADLWHMTPMECVHRLLKENTTTVRGIYFAQNEKDMMNILAHPLVCAGTDWSDQIRYMPPETVAGGHPRGTATMVHRLELLRDHGLMSKEAAIHSVTGLTADTCGLADKIGLLKEGRSADLCVLDWEALRSHADFIHPFRKNEGIEYVFVNGVLSVEKGLYNGALSGKVLRKR